MAEDALDPVVEDAADDGEDTHGRRPDDAEEGAATDHVLLLGTAAERCPPKRGHDTECSGCWTPSG
ncbi:hypothetical protein GCM10022256_10680 [Frondihabitans peucedani]|uniref:Uncharacterized protein n=1 Tax=Frondihabitans peucedani TaxID=598626 RepID=A0ABP8DZQ7_9MICO